jgi:predicted O-methyltransferase YrrM
MGLRAVTRAASAKLVFERVFPLFERLGLHVLPVHFYSPVPDTRQLRHNLERWHREWSLAGIDLDLEHQRDWIGQLADFQSEFDTLPSEADVASRGFGEGYGEVESRILYAMLRKIKPATVIEVGSGVSTFFAASALSMNRHDDDDGRTPRIVSIEPYPYRTLRTLPGLIPGVQFDMITRQVQDVELEVFQELNDGDVLFIDSSHVSKLDSDVNRLYLEVLPSLRPGVFIHIDDIPFPYQALNPEHWIFKKHRFWNEAALLNAFLAFNSSFRIMFSLSYLHCKQPDVLQTLLPYDAFQHHPSSIWLQRVR